MSPDAKRVAGRRRPMQQTASARRQRSSASSHADDTRSIVRRLEKYERDGPRRRGPETRGCAGALISDRLELFSRVFRLLRPTLDGALPGRRAARWRRARLRAAPELAAHATGADRAVTCRARFDGRQRWHVSLAPPEKGEADASVSEAAGRRARLFVCYVARVVGARRSIGAGRIGLVHLEAPRAASMPSPSSSATRRCPRRRRRRRCSMCRRTRRRTWR